MTQDEYNETLAQVEAVSVQDVHLGRALRSLLAHLAALSGVGPQAPPEEEEPEPTPLPARSRRQP
jgi:hypothetical protein